MSAEAAAGATTQTWRYSVCDPPHPGVGGTHLHHLDPLTKTSRGGSSPMSPPAWKHCPRALQGLRRCCKWYNSELGNSNYYTTFSVSKGVIQRKKESRSSVTSSPNDKQIDLALWLWQSKQG